MHEVVVPDRRSLGWASLAAYDGGSSGCGFQSNEVMSPSSYLLSIFVSI
jgi:hypothetical protein